MSNINALKWYAERASSLKRYMEAKPPRLDAIEAVITELALDNGMRAQAQQADTGDISQWLDKHGACKICQGEIPDGHQSKCFIYAQERHIKELQAQQADTPWPMLRDVAEAAQKYHDHHAPKVDAIYLATALKVVGDWLAEHEQKVEQ